MTCELARPWQRMHTPLAPSIMVLLLHEKMQSNNRHLSSERSHHMDGPPREEQQGHFWHAQSFRTHVVPMQILVSVVQGLAAGCPPLKKLDGVEIVFLQVTLY